MDKYIAANWKMNNDFSDIPSYVEYLDKNLENKNNVVVCVPHVMLKTFADAANGIVETGAENCYFAEKGAYTGETSAKMVKSAGASYVIIGHSERRQYFGETNEIVSKKIAAALSAGLKVIFCIGEKLEQKENFKEVLNEQIVDGLAGITDFSDIIVAYEPVWAIGTGVVATIDDIKTVHAYIKSVLKEKFGVDLPILYGGSVKPENSAEIMALEDVGGVLVGGACLKADSFAQIAKSR
ncbi:MAG: triose-phosphate isomerase [Clostridia bacterium]|nr:triose-phosphate isomerase [Clostridia bacterium]